MNGRNYHAFLSYSHSDRAWAAWLHRGLETFQVPKRLVAAGAPPRLSPIFRDRDELPSATDLGQKIEQALQASRALIVVCSPRAASSHWVNEEVVRFLDLGRSGRIYCLLVAGEPNASARGFDPALECLPAALRAAQGVEPLAADVRAGGDGRQNAKLKIAAGLLDVGLDELRRRDLQRRNRRLAWLAAGSLAGGVLASGLAVFAWLARNDAQANRLLAEREAETARQTTQFMVGLFDVVDPGEARGRTVTAYEILERGVDRIGGELADQPAVRATLMQTMGRVFTGLGLYPRATDLLRDALAIHGTTATLDALATRVALADALYLAGDYAGAEQHYRQVVDTTTQQEGWNRLRSNAANGLADVLTQHDDLDAAIALYRDTLARDRDALDRDDAQIARTANGLATALLYRGDLEEAESSYREALDAYRAALGSDHPKVAETINNLGAVRYFSGDPAGAADLYREALPLYRKLFGENHPEVAMVLNNLGRIELERDDIRAALPLLEESVAIDRELGRAEHDDFVFALNSLAIAYRASGDVKRARRSFEEAAGLAERHQHRLLGPILVNRADLLCTDDRSADAIGLLTHAQRLIDAEYADEPWHRAILDNVRGRCLGSLGRVVEGEQLLLASLPIIENRWGQNALFTREARSRLAEHYARLRR